MKWDRSETLALAMNRCVHCHGIGLQWQGRREPSPCQCVLRGIFRACFQRFQFCATKDKHIPRTTFDFTPGATGKFSWSRKEEEYVADFYLVAKRTLTPSDFSLFKYHFLYGADWRLCSRKLGIEKSPFFQRVYLIQERLGRVFRELRPYPLFPLDEYFNGTRRLVTPQRLTAVPAGSETRPRVVTMAKTA